MTEIHQQNSSEAFAEVDFFSRDLRLHGRYFNATGPAKGNFLLLHGLTSNSAWFVRIATVLANAGYNVLVYDRRGSGESAGARGDVPGKDAFLWDMKAAANYIWGQSAQPLHIMAFSYSWKLPPVFVRQLDGEGRKVASLIFVAPASDLKDEVKPSFIDQLKILINWRGRYHTAPIRDTHLTQNSATLDWIRNSNESKPQLKFTRRFFLASKALDRDAGEIVPTLKKPMLVLLPKSDRVIDIGKVRQRFLRGPTGYQRKVIDIEGSHIVDTPEAQRDLSEKVLAWLKPAVPAPH